MDVTPLIRQGQQVIQAYADGTFKVSGKVYNHPIIVTPEATLAWDAPEGVEDLKLEHFLPPQKPPHPNPLPDRERGFVGLLGTGKIMKFLPLDIRKSLKEKGISMDAMDTGAACRTYNVLVAEGRLVAAFLLPYR